MPRICSHSPPCVRPVPDAGDDRDVAAAARDAVADRADRAADARDAVALSLDCDDRSHDQCHRRGRAHRLTAAGDRARAGADRSASRQDRIAAAHDRRTSATDDLNSAYRRDAGIGQLERSLGIARDSGTAMVVCFVDVDGLKAINDTDGHPAGDRILRRVAEVIDDHLDCDDTLLRYGGDEFIFSVLGPAALDIDDTTDAIEARLRASDDIAITCGIAFARERDTVADVIENADRDLYRQRRASRATVAAPTAADAIPGHRPARSR